MAAKSATTTKSATAKKAPAKAAVPTVSPAMLVGAKAPAALKARAPKSTSSAPAITMGSGPVPLMRNQIGKPGAGANAGISRVVKERIALAETNRQAKYRQGLVDQVTAAKQSNPFTSLAAGSPAFTIAESILDLFLTVEPIMGTDGKQAKSRTTVAIDMALAKLEDSYVLKHAGAIELGKKRAFAALNAGFNNKKQSIAVVSTPEV